VASMSSEQCLTQLGESRDILVARYRRDAEVALVRADFLNSLEIITLQALTIYIVSIPKHRALYIDALANRQSHISGLAPSHL